MKKEIEKNTDPTVSASSVMDEVPPEIIKFFQGYFLPEKPDIEAIKRAELLAKTLIRFMLQLYRMGVEGEFQPVFFATNYVKPHTGNVTECKRTYETIGGEPYERFNLGFLTQNYEQAYREWTKETFGVELDEKAAEALQQWGGVLNS